MVDTQCGYCTLPLDSCSHHESALASTLQPLLKCTQLELTAIGNSDLADGRARSMGSVSERNAGTVSDLTDACLKSE
jgi:hypothetical protein